MAKQKTTSEFIQEAKAVWGDRFDYSKTNYVNWKTKVTITCKEHGEFSQYPTSHIKKMNGCKQCPISRRKTTSQFISEAKAIWGDRFDYSKTEYKTINKRVTIICREHNHEFEQLAHGHLQKHVGCNFCKSQTARENVLKR